MLDPTLPDLFAIAACLRYVKTGQLRAGDRPDLDKAVCQPSRDALASSAGARRAKQQAGDRPGPGGDADVARARSMDPDVDK